MVRSIMLACLAATAIGCSQEPQEVAPAELGTAGAAVAPSAEAANPQAERIRNATASLDGERIINADSEPGNWLAHGRTYDEARFSPLTAIDEESVDDLGLAWYWDTGTTRGLEATPIVVDGVMFTTGSWSMVWAHDAATGELI